MKNPQAKEFSERMAELTDRVEVLARKHDRVLNRTRWIIWLSVAILMACFTQITYRVNKSTAAVIAPLPPAHEWRYPPQEPAPTATPQALAPERIR